MTLTRRQFVKHSAVAATALSLPMAASSRVLGANDEIRVGIIGVGGRGGGCHLPIFLKQPGVRVTAICDPDQSRLERCAGIITDRYKAPKVDTYSDMRKLIDSPNVDAISVATMQYWHALPVIWACQAGKDVYCEKPLSHFIWEGRQMVKAARKYNRVVQVGTQSRSHETVRTAMDYIHSGELGKIKYVVAMASKPRYPIGNRKEPLPIPKGVDYELWCGPARKEPIYRDRLQYDCSFIWNTGDGESCNQGVHEIDVARWILGEEKLPRRVISLGGRFTYNDVGNVPNTQIIYYDFPSVPVLYEMHNLRAAKGSKAAPKYRGSGLDVCVHCEGGYVMVHNPGAVFDNEGKEIRKLPDPQKDRGDVWGVVDHFKNFLAAVRSGRAEDLNADIEVGHISTAITHTGNISYRLGKKAGPAEIRKQLKEVPLFGEMYDRMRTHLKAHEVDVDAETVTLGPWLDIDRENECFVDNAKANELAKGSYRKPWIIEKV